jgi:cytochrome c oxidase cbb3-type subunit III
MELSEEPAIRRPDSVLITGSAPAGRRDRVQRRPISVYACLLSVILAAAIPCLAQGGPALQNPLAQNATNAERGHHYFYSNCGICHGFNAQGGEKGPRLNTGEFRHGSSDAELYRTITQGLPGTIMPGNALVADEVWAIIIYLRSQVTAARSGVKGNEATGKEFFWGNGRCAECHMVQGKGGVLGPDLSRIGMARTVAHLAGKIRDPNKELSTGLREPNADYIAPITNATVTAITKSGRRIRGVPKNEDTFSLQMVGTDNEIHVFQKRDLAEIIHEDKSLMPAYNLKETELNDLIAYLATLK